MQDAIPEAERERLDRERLVLLSDIDEKRGTPTPAELHEVRQIMLERLEKTLDGGHGSCALRRPELARLVRDALLHKDGDPYRLLTWTIMPNHVHVVFDLDEKASLDGVMKSWKGFTARMANRILGREGAFWQADYFDRLIRNRKQLLHAVRYVETNAARAGLRDWPWGETYAERFIEDGRLADVELSGI